MVRYLDLLEDNGKAFGADVFERFLQFLGDHPAVYSVQDQLRTELRAERGELMVDDYLSFETTVAVKREFAGQGRTDAERREFATLISIRMQVYKEVIVILLIFQ